MPLQQPSFSMASGADLPSAASDGDSQSESDVIPVQRNEADFVPETEDEDEDVSSEPQTLELWSRLIRRRRAIFGLAGTTTC